MIFLNSQIVNCCSFYSRMVNKMMHFCYEKACFFFSKKEEFYLMSGLKVTFTYVISFLPDNLSGLKKNYI